MRALLATAALALSLSACASLQPPGGGLSTVLTSKEAFDRACAERGNAYALFRAYDAVRPVSDDLRRTVRVANNQIARTCKKPPASLAEAALIVTRAVQRIKAAYERN